MEAGAKVSGKTLIMENPGGGSIHSSQKAGATTTTTSTAEKTVVAKPAAEKTTTAAPSAAAEKAAPAAAPSSSGFDVNEKVQAKFSEDGRWYNAVIRGIKGDLFTVYYSDYGNTENVSIASLRKFNTPAVKGNAAPANKQQTNTTRNNASQRSNNRLDR